MTDPTAAPQKITSTFATVRFSTAYWIVIELRSDGTYAVETVTDETGQFFVDREDGQAYANRLNGAAAVGL